MDASILKHLRANGEQLDADISQLSLSLYHPSANLREDLPPETKAHYERKIGNFNQVGRERILITMMKVNFLKRLESSIDSFRLTLERTVECKPEGVD